MPPVLKRPALQVVGSWGWSDVAALGGLKELRKLILTCSNGVPAGAFGPALHEVRLYEQHGLEGLSNLQAAPARLRCIELCITTDLSLPRVMFSQLPGWRVSDVLSPPGHSVRVLRLVRPS